MKNTFNVPEGYLTGSELTREDILKKVREANNFDHLINIVDNYNGDFNEPGVEQTVTLHRPMTGKSLAEILRLVGSGKAQLKEFNFIPEEIRTKAEQLLPLEKGI